MTATSGSNPGKPDSQNHLVHSTRGRYSPIGVDPGGKLVKALQLRRKGGRLAVYRQAVLPVKAGTFHNGSVADHGLLREIFAHLKAEHRWHGNRVNLSLGAKALFMRRVVLPPMNESERRRAMGLEVEQHFPLDPEEAVFDYCPAEPGQSGGGSREDYLLAAVPGPTAGAYTFAAASAGFYPCTLEPGPFSIHRSFSLFAGKHEHTGILLDIGYDGSTLLIGRGPLYLYHRHLKTGVSHFYRSVMNQDRAGTAAHLRVFDRQSLEQRGLSRVAASLCGEVTHSLAYWFERVGGGPKNPARLYLCGGGALIPGLAQLLQVRTGLSPVLYNPLTTALPCRKGGEETSTAGSLFAAAFGLALRGWLK